MPLDELEDLAGDGRVRAHVASSYFPVPHLGSAPSDGTMQRPL
jgi:hypothetical protein